MTSEEETALRAKIADAEAKYHKLMIGTMPRVVVDQNGERVEFTAANRVELYRYIQSLKALLPDAVAGALYSRPIGFIF